MTKNYHVTVIAANEIVIVYLDDTKVLSNRVFSSIGKANLCLYAREMEAEISGLEARTVP